MSNYFVGYSTSRVAHRSGDLNERCPVGNEVLPPKNEDWVVLDDHFRQLGETALAKVPDRVTKLRDTLNRRVGAAYTKWPSPAVAVGMDPYNHVCARDCKEPLSVFSYRGVKYVIGFHQRGAMTGPLRIIALCAHHTHESFPLLDAAVRDLYSYPAYEPPAPPAPRVPTPEELAVANLHSRLNRLLAFRDFSRMHDESTTPAVLDVIREVAREEINKALADRK